MVLIDATTGENLGEPIHESELATLRASIERDIAALAHDADQSNQRESDRRRAT
jgi:hypothetical protein